MEKPIIQVQNLGKRYRLGQFGAGSLREELQLLTKRFRNGTKKSDKKDFWALEDVSFDVNAGEAIGIVGKNGAGKSTLLKLISRITEPTKGDIFLRGRVASLLEVGTGFHPELSGRENIYLNGTILGMRKNEIDRKLDEIIDFSGVEKHIDTPVKRYSSGMNVRLGFAVAAHLEPEILIVDEVLAVGDANFQKKCLGKMKDVAGQGRTVLFVSHNMSAISNLTKRSVLLEKGRLVDYGETHEIIAQYLFSNDKNESKIQFQNTGSLSGQIDSIGLSDTQGNNKLEYSTSETITIEIQYSLNRKLSNMFLEFYVFDSSGNHLITSGLQDHWNDKETPFLPGKHSVKTVIPSNLLNSGKYHLKVNLSDGNAETLSYLDCQNITLLDDSDKRIRSNRKGSFILNQGWEHISHER